MTTGGDLGGYISYLLVVPSVEGEANHRCLVLTRKIESSAPLLVGNEVGMS